MDKNQNPSLLQGDMYERGFFFGEPEGHPTLFYAELTSLNARREFLLSGKLNLVIYGPIPAGVGVCVGDPDSDPGTPFPIKIRLEKPEPPAGPPSKGEESAS